MPRMAISRLKADAFGIIPSTLNKPRHIFEWTSKFTRKLVGGRLGGEVSACSEMIDRISLPQEVFASCAN